MDPARACNSTATSLNAFSKAGLDAESILQDAEEPVRPIAGAKLLTVEINAVKDEADRVHSGLSQEEGAREEAAETELEEEEGRG